MRMTNEKVKRGRGISGFRRRLILLVIGLGLFLPAVTVFGAAIGVPSNVKDQIKADYSNGTWNTVKQGNLEGIEGKITGWTGITGFTHYSKNSSLTFTNISGKNGTLEFFYTAAIGTGVDAYVKVDGVNAPNNSQKKFSKSGWANGDTVKIEMESGKGKTSTSKITITGIKFVSESEVEVTFKAPQGNGIYTVTGADGVTETVNANTSSAGLQKKQLATKPFTLKANPEPGYKLRGWYSETEGAFLSTETPFENKFEKDDSVYPVFIPKDDPVWEVGTQWFTDLHDALSYAKTSGNKLITLILSGTLPAGTYNIESGYTLLIPMDELKTNYTADNYCDEDGGGIVFGSWTKPNPYRTLTMAAGAEINVKGTLNVAGRFSALGTRDGSRNGMPTGSLGRIDMCSGSAINVQSGGNLYAFGYITGDNNVSNKDKGTVTVESGGFVHECFQIRNFRGGTATSDLVSKNKRVFPFYQYYVQNVEVPLKMHFGALEYVYSGLFMKKDVGSGSIGKTLKTPTGQVPFIGNASAGLFRISSGSITRTYVSAEDRVYYEVDNGSVSLGQISLKISEANVDSQEYVLPIYENIELSLHNSTATVQQDLALLPGVKFNIDENSTLEIGSGFNCFVYDTNQWNDLFYYGGVLVLPYTAATRGARAAKNSATIDVKGTIQVSGGFYTTESGAAITGSEGGQVIYKQNAGTQATVNRAEQTGTDVEYPTIPITSAKLKNADESYTSTENTAAGTTYEYMNGRWGKPITITYDRGQGESGEPFTEKVLSGEGFTLPDKAKASAAFKRAGFKIIGWNTAADGSGTSYGLGANASFTADTTLYAQWGEAKITLTFKEGAEDVTGDMPAQSFEEGATSVTLNPCGFIRPKHVFTGWTDGKGNTYKDGHTFTGENIPEENLTLTAQWERVGYTITFNANDGAGTMTPQDFDVRKDFTLNNNKFSRQSYKFIGWSESADATTATYTDKQQIPAQTWENDLTLYAVWQELPTVTFHYNYEGAGDPYITYVNQYNQIDIVLQPRPGYRFDGCSRDPNGSVEFKADTQYVITESIVLYAQWTKEVKLTFKANATDANPTADHVIYGYEGEKVTMPGNTQFTHKYYELRGWATSVNATEPDYGFGQEIDTPAEDTTLYAVWHRPVYDVTINWEPLKFTYVRTYTWNPDELKYEQGVNSWRNQDTSGNLLTTGAAVEIINNSTDTLSRVSATVTYVPTEGFASNFEMKYGTTVGAFPTLLDAADNAYRTGVLAYNETVSKKIFLMLSGEPNETLNQAIVGTVHVSFQREPKA